MSSRPLAQQGATVPLSRAAVVKLALVGQWVALQTLVLHSRPLEALDWP